MRFRHFAILLLVLLVCMAALYPISVRCGVPKAQSPPTTSKYPTEKPLVNSKTEAIFANATRVQVFRLMESDQETFLTKAQTAELNKGRSLEDEYEIIGNGNEQGHAFAKKLSSSLWRIGDPKSSNRAQFSYLQCFSPGVAFRAWRGKEEATAFVCFHCSGVEVVSRDAHGREIWHGWAGLGDQRAILLALSKKALPKDAEFRALKS